MDEKESTRELVVVDVKRYKKVKKALAESEERYRQLFENVPIGIYRTTPDGRFVDANPSLVKMLGYGSFEELAARNLEKDYFDVEYPRAHYVARLKREGEIKGFEAVWLRKDGSRIDVRENVKLVSGQDREVFYEGTVEDITQSRIAEEAQRIRSQQIEILNCIISKGNLAESLADMLEVILDCVTLPLDFDTAAVFLYDPGAKKMNLLAARGGKKNQYLKEKYLAVENLPFARVLKGEPVFVDHVRETIPDLAKSWGWRMASSIPLLAKGRVIGALNMASCKRQVFSPEEKSILEMIGKEAGTLISKLQTETALRESEEYYRTLIDISPDIIVVLDLNAKLLTISQQFLKSGGYFLDEVIGASSYDFITGLEHVVLEKRTEAFIKKNILSKSEYSFRRKDGGSIPLEVSATLLNDAKGRPKGIIAIGRDISERKNKEEDLRQSEETFRRTFENIPDPAYIWTRQGDRRIILTNANQAAFRITQEKIKQYFGVDVEKLFSKNPDYVTRIRQVMDNGKNQNHEIEYNFLSTGEKKWLQVDYVKTAENSIMVITKDVSERKEAEARLLAYQGQLRSLTSELTLIEEKERRRIASELHDQIGQNLALCKLKIATLEKGMDAGAEKNEIVAVQRLLECSIQDARSLIFDLSPPVLYELGFTAALEWLAERIQEQFHVQVEFESRIANPELDNDRQVILFQVVRELLVNVGKHSQASQAKVILSLEEPLLKIQVNDDGVGFDASRIFSPKGQSGGFGFFSMRERLNYLGGGLEVKSKPGKGSQIVLTVPLHESRTIARKENS